MQRRRDVNGGGEGHHQRTMSAVTQKFQLTDHYLGGFDSLTSASLMEVDIIFINQKNLIILFYYINWLVLVSFSICSFFLSLFLIGD